MRSARADANSGLRTPGWTVTLAGALALAVLGWWLIPWEHWNAVKVDPALVDEYFTPAEIERAETYSFRARAWSWSGLAVSILTLALLTTQPSRRRLIALVPAGWWWVRASLLTVLVLGVQRLVTLPFAWGGYRLRREYGLSTQSTSEFLLDVVRNFLVGAVPVLLVVLIVMGCARSIGRWWPAVAGAVLSSAVILGSFVYPVLVEPLSHDFKPLAEGELREEVERLAVAEGVAIDDVVVADASRRTTTLNAWVSGIGPTRRVVLYDTLIEQVPRDQVLVVVAHELAHARNNDVVVGTVLGVGGAVVGVGLLAVILPWRPRNSAERSGAWSGRRLTSVSTVPVLVLLLAVGAQLSAPAQNGVSRALERRADAVALEMTQDPDAFVEVQMSLARRSLADPTPPRLSYWWWGSHPTTLERISGVSRSPSP